MKKTKKQIGNWDLTQVYSSEKDPQIEKDVVEIEKLYADFARQYSQDRTYLENEEVLFVALTAYEELVKKGSFPKPLHYFYFVKDIDSQNAYAKAQIQLLTSRLTNAGNSIIFFTLSLGKISQKKQKEFLASKKLAHFRYFLKTIFDQAKFTLGEAEEKVLSLKSQPAHAMWEQAREKLNSKLTVLWQGKEIPIAEAHFQIQNLATKPRRKLHTILVQKLKEHAYMSEIEINALYTNKKIDDELRGFKKPYEGTVLNYQNDIAVVENLVDTITKNFSVSHQYYRLKSKILKEKTLTYADRGGGVTKKTGRHYPFAESVEVLKKAFGKVDPKYVIWLENYITEGRVDAFPKKGKAGGAYCWPSQDLPTFVLLNHTEGDDSLMTFGHEMGHAFHSEYCKEQSPLYLETSFSLAETASTLFENFVFEEILETLSPKDKVIALHDRLNDDISTIFRQIACFNFERSLHTAIREKGYLDGTEIAELHNAAMSAYLGPKVKLTDDDGYLFVTWSHIRRFFYVYSYAYGQLVSRILYRRYKQDKKFLTKIEEFLSAGGSDTPENILKKIGIDVSDPTFFEEGIASIKEDITRLEELMKKFF